MTEAQRMEHKHTKKKTICLFY